jgi:photosystem II stability/assembly factor-like uncharacterized protein
MSRLAWLAALALSATVARGADPPATTPRWLPQLSGTKARLRGVCAVSDQVAWASGTGGTYTRSADGGQRWASGQVPGAEALDFRDVEVFDARTAVLLSSGPGDQSRVYRTTDSGVTWSLRFTNPDRSGFLDALAFWDADHGLVLGDPVNGRFRVFLTDDGGASWRAADPAGMPPALEREGAFAASGTCLFALRGTRLAWFGTGGASSARVFRTTDGGRAWTAAGTPVPAGSPSSGVFSVGFRDARTGLAVGGDYKAPGRPGPFVALSHDGGERWTVLDPEWPGYRSAVAMPSGEGPPWFVAVGPTGSDFITGLNASGRATLGPPGFHAVSLTRDGNGWAVGDDGRVARLLVATASK